MGLRVLAARAVVPAGLAGTAAAAEAFDASRDATRVALCYGAYMELQTASAAVGDAGVGEAYLQQSIRGRERLRPYAEAASPAMGSQAFTTLAVRSQLPRDLAIRRGPSWSNRRIAAQIAAEAAACGQQLDRWRAPPETRDAHEILSQAHAR